MENEQQQTIEALQREIQELRLQLENRPLLGLGLGLVIVIIFTQVIDLYKG